MTTSTEPPSVPYQYVCLLRHHLDDLLHRPLLHMTPPSTSFLLMHELLARLPPATATPASYGPTKAQSALIVLKLAAEASPAPYHGGRLATVIKEELWKEGNG